MAYVITRLCIDCKDLSCTEVCPVDCIYEYTGSDPNIPKSQLLIDPEECIDCNACEPSCPWQAIFPGDEVPDAFAEDTEKNARIAGVSDREIPERDSGMDNPTPEQIEENKKKWGMSA